MRPTLFLARDRVKSLATRLSGQRLSKPHRVKYGEQINGHLPTLAGQAGIAMGLGQEGQLDALQDELRGEMASALCNTEGKLKVSLAALERLSNEAAEVAANVAKDPAANRARLVELAEMHQTMRKQARNDRYNLSVQRHACGFAMANLNLEQIYPIPPKLDPVTGELRQRSAAEEQMDSNRRKMAMYLRFGVKAPHVRLDKAKTQESKSKKAGTLKWGRLNDDGTER